MESKPPLGMLLIVCHSLPSSLVTVFTATETGFNTGVERTFVTTGCSGEKGRKTKSNTGIAISIARGRKPRGLFIFI